MRRDYQINGSVDFVQTLGHLDDWRSIRRIRRGDVVTIVTNSVDENEIDNALNDAKVESKSNWYEVKEEDE